MHDRGTIDLPPELTAAVDSLRQAFRDASAIPQPLRRGVKQAGLGLLGVLWALAALPVVTEGQLKRTLAEGHWLLSERMKRWLEVSPILPSLSEEDLLCRLSALLTPSRGSELLDSWCNRPAFAARRQALEEAMASHMDGRFYAAVATWLSATDGTMQSEFDWASDKSAFSKRYPGLLDDISHLGEASFQRAMSASTLRSVVDSLAVNRHAAEEGRLNRHKIVHDATEPVTEAHSLQCILLLDLLYELLEQAGQPSNHESPWLALGQRMTSGERVD